MTATLSSRAAGAVDSFDAAYQETSFLLVEADLRLHHRQLSELSLHVLRPPEAAAVIEASPSSRSTSAATLPHAEQVSSLASFCRKEAEESIRTRLQVAAQELSARPIAQEKLKGFVATWLAAMKVISRAVSRAEALLAQQDEDC